MKKVTTLRLIILLVVLVIIYAITEFVSSTGRSRSLRADLVQIDTTKVTQVRISNSTSSTLLQKEDKDWKVSDNPTRSFTAMPDKIKNALASIQTVKPSRIVTKDPEKWIEFQVDSSGTRVEIFEGNNKSLDIILGRFGMQDQQRYHTYVRLFEDNAVYVANNFMGFSLPADVASYRDQTLTNFSADSISNVQLVYPGDSSVRLEKSINGHWLVNSEQADSASTVSYLQSLSRLNSNKFTDKDPGSQQVQYKTIIQLVNAEEISISSYENPMGDPILISSRNDEGVFSDKATFDKVFKSKSEFLKKDEE